MVAGPPTRPGPMRRFALVALLAVPAALRAQNLVSNPGFEGAAAPGGAFGLLQPDGYAVTFGAARSYAGLQYQNGGPASNAVYVFGDLPPARTALAQTLTTVPGTRYRIVFRALEDAFGGVRNDRLTVTFGKATVFDALLSNDAFQEFTAAGVAAGAATTLAFSAYDAPGLILLDDLSVTVVVTPEPSSLVLAGAGLAAVWAARRRRA